MNKNQFIEKINNIKTKTPAEELIVGYFIEHFTMLPFAKINELCDSIGVGKATIGRFVQRLGFNGFLDFKKSVSQDLVEELQTPIQRYENDDHHIHTQSVLDKHLNEINENINDTFSSISLRDFETALSYMRNKNGKLYILGSASAEPLALYFYILSRYLRNDVILLKSDITNLPHQLVDVSENDTLFAISYHRFSSVTVKVTKWFSQHGGRVITLTDQAVNPFIGYSDVQLNVTSTSDGYFNNRTSGFCLIEALTKGLSINPDKDNRFNRIESLFSEFGMFKT